MRITRRDFLAAASLAGAGFLLAGARPVARAAEGTGNTLRVYSVAKKGYVMTEKVRRSDAEWRKILTPQQYDVTRKKGTEPPFTGALLDNKAKGTYKCVGCGLDLFRSETKFDSGTGWPSYYAPVAKENVRTEKDRSLWVERIEVLCARCDAHLGHVFDDGPPPTGLRYCMNSAALKFEKD